MPAVAPVLNNLTLPGIGIFLQVSEFFDTLRCAVTIIHLVVPLYVGNHTFHVDFAIKSRINNYEKTLQSPWEQGSKIGQLLHRSFNI